MGPHRGPVDGEERFSSAIHRVGDVGQSIVGSCRGQRLLNLTGPARCAQIKSERSESEVAEDPTAPAPTKPSLRLVNVRWSGPWLALFARDAAGLMAWRHADDIK
jgi:hypothetical protein